MSHPRPPDRRRRSPRGFTLVELMLVVTIIGVLTTFAVPYFYIASARAQRTEVEMVLAKLHVYSLNQYRNNGNYNPGTNYFGGATPAYNPQYPGGVAPGISTPWIIPASTACTGSPVGCGWIDLPFPPEGGLRFRYFWSGTGQQLHIHVHGSFGAIPALNSSAYDYDEIWTGEVLTSQSELPSF